MVICRRIEKRWVATLIYFFIMMIIASYFNIYSTKYFYGRKETQNLVKNITQVSNHNMLDGCFHVYLDVGSNIGVQIRKLYEPRLYPEAHVHRIFNSVFSPAEVREDKNYPLSICAIGFEPNPHHTQYLKEIETSYRKCGWRVWFYTETAVSNREGTATFYTDADNKHLEWGSGIISPEMNKIANHTVSKVNLIRLSSFLQDVVGKRKIPEIGVKSLKPKVVMKMDVEGSEVDIIPDLVFTGGLQYVNTLMLEWHQRLELLPDRRKGQKLLMDIINALDQYSKVMKGKTFDFESETVDDERYFNSTFELPKC